MAEPVKKNPSISTDHPPFHRGLEGNASHFWNCFLLLLSNVESMVLSIVLAVDSCGDFGVSCVKIDIFFYVHEP